MTHSGKRQLVLGSATSVTGSAASKATGGFVDLPEDKNLAGKKAAGLSIGLDIFGGVLSLPVNRRAALLVPSLAPELGRFGPIAVCQPEDMVGCRSTLYRSQKGRGSAIKFSQPGKRFLVGPA